MPDQTDEISYLLALISELDFEAFVPETLQEYVPLLEEGLAVFINELPEERCQQLLAEQAALPAAATIQQRMIHWMRGCPTLHKLGQLLARDKRLPVELRVELQQLESQPAKTCITQIRSVLETEIGSLESQRITLADSPLAEASVAVVVRFRSPAGSGVLKVLKPGIEQQLDEDLAAWDKLAEFMDAHRVRLGLDHIDYQDTLRRVRELLCNEIDLTVEQQHLVEARELYAKCSHIVIPELLPHCSRRVTAMEFIDGCHIASMADSDQKRLARIVADALLVTPVFNSSPEVLFHGDPHAGNLLVTEDGKIGLIDWGLAAHLSKQERESVTQILVGCLLLDSSRICAELETLAVRIPDAQALRTCVDRAIASIAQKPVGGMLCVMELLDAVVMSGHAVFDDSLLLFRKLVHITEGVIADLDPRYSLDARMMQAGFQHYLLETPERTFAAPCSRAFDTHLSNLDLVELLFSGPLVMLRRWQLAYGCA